MSGRRKRAPLGEGIGDGLSRIQPGELGRGLGDGLVRISGVWLPGGKFAAPQPCAVGACERGPFSSRQALNNHLLSTHPGMSDRERSYALDTAQRAAVRQAMNGRGRSS